MDLDNRSRGAASLWSTVSCQLSVVSSLCCLLLPLASCAKVGDPLPPLVRHPETVTNLKVVQVGDHFQIVFSLPPGEIERVEFTGNVESTLPSLKRLKRRPVYNATNSRHTMRELSSFSRTAPA